MDACGSSPWWSDDLSLAASRAQHMANASTEVGLIVLDTIEVFMHDFQHYLTSSATTNEHMDQARASEEQTDLPVLCIGARESN